MFYIEKCKQTASIISILLLMVDFIIFNHEQLQEGSSNRLYQKLIVPMNIYPSIGRIVIWQNRRELIVCCNWENNFG